jgi:heme-binding protein
MTNELAGHFSVMQEKKIMRKLVKLISILFASVFLGMQFVPTATTPKPSATAVGPHMADMINPQVGAILDRSCRDCHSRSTAWPWYSHVAPVSWIVSKHVSEAREVLDFSGWTNQPVSAFERLMICNAVSSGQMPLPEYTLMHRKAKLSKKDVELICGWAAAPSAPMTSPQVSKSTNQKE